EDEKRCDEVVARTPEVIVFPVEVLPKRFARKRQGSFHAGLIASFGDGGEHLLGERSRAVHVIQPDRDRKIVFRPQGWEETWWKGGSVGETRYAVQQGERVPSDKPEQCVNLVAASGEECAVTLGEWRQPDPRVLLVGKMGCAHWDAACKRRSRMISVSVLTNSG